MITFGEITLPITPSLTGRQLVNVEIFRNSETYNWQVYVPALNVKTLIEYLTANATIYENAIIRKEAIWSESPKTRTYVDHMTGQPITLNIPKEEVVRPTIPDFYEVIARQDIFEI